MAVGRGLSVGAGDTTVTGHDPTAHAIASVISVAAAQLRTWRLEGMTVVATHEPCTMCAGALLASRVDRLVFGAVDRDQGAAGSRYNVLVDPRLGHEVLVTAGLSAPECEALDTRR
jgi:tRNA(adenine34) deaminase